jgi:hypothetical protein
MTDRLAEIRARLEAATPDNLDSPVVSMKSICDLADNALDDIKYLLELVGKLRFEVCLLEAEAVMLRLPPIEQAGGEG